MGLKEEDILVYVDNIWLIHPLIDNSQQWNLPLYNSKGSGLQIAENNWQV